MSQIEKSVDLLSTVKNIYCYNQSTRPASGIYIEVLTDKGIGHESRYIYIAIGLIGLGVFFNSCSDVSFSTNQGKSTNVQCQNPPCDEQCVTPPCTPPPPPVAYQDVFFLFLVIQPR